MAKINISLPDQLLDEVDALAKELCSSRSGFVAEATARYVATVSEARARAERLDRIDRAVERAKQLGESVGSFDSTAAIRADRSRDDGPGQRG